jgi:hypothetical protein
MRLFRQVQGACNCLSIILVNAPPFPSNPPACNSSPSSLSHLLLHLPFSTLSVSFSSHSPPILSANSSFHLSLPLQLSATGAASEKSLPQAVCRLAFFSAPRAFSTHLAHCLAMDGRNISRGVKVGCPHVFSVSLPSFY